MDICMMTCCCPCVQHGRNAEKLGDSCFVAGCLVLIPAVQCCVIGSVRGRTREKYGIPGSFMEDCMLSWCCGGCVIVQTATQLNEPTGGK
jgi:Cys-rich protein (TIGR01571 family)